jgi:hypothetical protein
MKYIVLHQGRVIWGPREWNPLSIENAIEFQSGSDVIIGADPVVGRLEQLQDFTILRVELEEIPLHDALFETLEGPFYRHNVPEGTTTIKWNVVPDTVPYIAGKIKQQIEAKRYQKEIEGIDIEIDGVMYKLPTDREQRNRMALLSINNEPIAWKFGGTWVDLTAEQLSAIVKQINTYVQKWFAWERGHVKNINACTTIDELQQTYQSFKNESTD